MSTIRGDIRLICFDLGGVLVRICRGWAEACDRAGVPNRLQDGEATWQRIHLALSDYEVGRIDSAEMVRRIAAITDGSETAHVERIIEAWLIDLYPGTAELIADIHAAGLPTACLSNTNDWHWRIMADDARFTPLGTLTHRYASHLVRSRKPEPAIYQHVETELSLPGESIVFFDDLPANIEAAAGRGWQGVLVDHAGDTVGQMRQHLESIKVLTPERGS